MNLEALAANPLVGLLSFVGGAALVYRLARSVLRLALNLAEKTTLDGLVEVSIRNGDLTGLAERRAAADLIRRARLRSALFAALWLALLVVPALAGVARVVYAACALLWLLPKEPIRLTPSPRVRVPVERPPNA